MKKYSDILNNYEFFKNYMMLQGTLKFALVLFALISFLVSALGNTEDISLVTGIDMISLAAVVIVSEYGFIRFFPAPYEAGLTASFNSSVFPVARNDMLRFWRNMYLKNAALLIMMCLVQNTVMLMRNAETVKMTAAVFICPAVAGMEILLFRLRHR